MNARAFTLIELLVLLVLLIIAGLSLVAMLKKLGREAPHVSTANNGKQLYTVLSEAFASAPGWPQSAVGNKRYSSSTEFFAELIASNIIEDLRYSYFAEDKIEPATTEAVFRDPAILHNAWCITLDIDNHSANIPVLFTQNFAFNTSGPGTRLDRMRGLARAAPPFGDYAGVVVQAGGSARQMYKAEATQANFNPSASSNTFLWPLASGQCLSGHSVDN